MLGLFMIWQLTSIQSIFDNSQTKILLKLWKPSCIHLSDIALILNQDDISEYVKARIHLENHNTFSIANLKNDELSLLVCTKVDSYTHRIDCCLWPKSAQKRIVFRDINKWHTHTFEDNILKIGDVDDASKIAWESLQYDE